MFTLYFCIVTACGFVLVCLFVVTGLSETLFMKKIRGPFTDSHFWLCSFMWLKYDL